MRKLHNASTRILPPCDFYTGGNRQRRFAAKAERHAQTSLHLDTGDVLRNFEILQSAFGEDCGKGDGFAGGVGHGAVVVTGVFWGYGFNVEDSGAVGLVGAETVGAKVSFWGNFYKVYIIPSGGNINDPSSAGSGPIGMSSFVQIKRISVLSDASHFNVTLSPTAKNNDCELRVITSETLRPGEFGGWRRIIGGYVPVD